MFEIIILFIIASILSNIVKALGRSASSQRSATPREVPSSVNETWTPERDVKIEAPKYEIKVETSVSDVERVPQAKPQVKSQVAHQVSSQANQNQLSSQRILTSFNPNRLVEGIILSEIIAPPKCRRQKTR